MSDYVLFSAGWVLLVITYNWLFQPFGAYLVPREEKQLYGAMMSAPVIVLVIFATRQLLRSRGAEKRNDL